MKNKMQSFWIYCLSFLLVFQNFPLLSTQRNPHYLAPTLNTAPPELPTLVSEIIELGQALGVSTAGVEPTTLHEELRKKLPLMIGLGVKKRMEVDHREGMITIAMPGRANLQPEVARQFPWMDRTVNGTKKIESDMRVPIIEELERSFRNVGLRIQVVKARPGERAINMLLLTTPKAMDRLFESGGPVERVLVHWGERGF